MKYSPTYELVKWTGLKRSLEDGVRIFILFLVFHAEDGITIKIIFLDKETGLQRKLTILK